MVETKIKRRTTIKKRNGQLAALLLAIVMILSFSVTPIFAAGDQTFKDVPESAWYHGYVEMLYGKGIVKGYGDTGEFRPNNTLIREHAAKMIALAAGLAYQGKKADFPDVDKEGEMSPYIAALKDKGAIQGFPDGTFRPFANIERGHAAKIVALAFGLLEGDMVSALTDLPEDADVKTAIKILESNGVVKGYGNTKLFKPEEEINRAEFAKILCIAMVVASIQKAEADPTPANIAAAQALVDQLPQGQDVPTQSYLQGRLDELGEEEEPPVGPTTIAVSAITVDKATMTLSTTEVGKTGTITATVGPANATNKTVTWTTSNAEVATVAKGVVTAVGVGEATITAKAGGETATTTVTVVAEEVIAATIGYEAVWNEARGTWYIKVTVPANDLDAASIKSISTIKEAGEKVTEPALTPDTDKVMWFGVAKADGEVTLKAAGEYAYEVVRQDDSKYIFNFTYAPGSVTGVEKPNVVNTTQNKGYNTIKEAITEAVSGATIKLNNNITIEANDFMNNNNDYAVMISGKSLILDLNGKTLSADAYSTVYLASTGVLTLKDSGSGGKIVNTNEETAYNAVGNYGTFTMESGTLDSVNGYALYNHYWSGTMYGTATIEGGTLTGGDRGIANCGILEISGGFITGGVYDIDNSGKLTISGNMTLDKMVVKDGSHAAGVVGKGTLTVGSGVTISGSGLNSTIEVNDGATITIEGTNNFYSADGNTQLTVTELPGKDFNWDSDKWVVAPIYVTPTTLQTALDNAEDGTMFILEEGNYGTIYFRQSETKSKPIDVTTWAGDGDVERYREFNDISIVGSTGAEVDQILVEAQQYFSTKEHSNKEYMTTHLSSYIAISNLTIKNIEFTGKEPVAVNLQSIWGHSSVNGLTIDGCTLTGKDEGKTAEASFLLRADGDTSAEIKDNQGSGELIMTTGRSNLTVKNCTVNNVWMPINITEWNVITISSNNFSNSGRNDIIITGTSVGEVNIIGNTLSNAAERSIRLNTITGNISITDNTIKDCVGREIKDEDGTTVLGTSLMHISASGEGTTVTLSGNSWNGLNDEAAVNDDNEGEILLESDVNFTVN